MASRAGWLNPFLVLFSVIAAIVIVPFIFIAFLFWAVEGSWDFEAGSLRYWLFMKGSRAEQLGLVSPAGRPVAYSVRLQEGNFPGWTVIQYESSASPAAIMDVYVKRCEAMKLKINVRETPDDVKPPVAAARLVCEIEPYLDAEFYAERKTPDALSEVGLRVWGSD